MRLSGEIFPPGDKSITHRALMLNAISYGKAKISHALLSEDIYATISLLKALGVKITMDNDSLTVIGNGFEGLMPPDKLLDCRNSGTTARLFLGLLSGLNFSSALIGDSSLSKRPMGRVVKYLNQLNGIITLTDNNYLPAKIFPSEIKANEINLDVKSAQVKSAILLAALKNPDISIIHEISPTRNHTELMLKYLGADITVNDLSIFVSGKKKLSASDIIVPGDISSAAFFIVGCLIVPDSEIVIRNCGINPTRTGILQVLDQIGADYEIKNRRTVCNEAVGDIYLRYTKNLRPFRLDKELIPLLIDEIPVLALLATQIEETSIIRDALELRVKESDRIKSVKETLTSLGADIEELSDGFVITGKSKLRPNTVNTYNDHRISMMLKIAKLLCNNLNIINPDSDKISYPDFENDLKKLLK